jgi:hypothetical protein
MGREIRRVPPDWKHPKNERGHYIPLYDKTFIEGERDHILLDLDWYLDNPEFLSEWYNDWPQPEWYRTAFEQEPTHYQIYETVTEGKPVSPVFATLEALAQWLVDQGYSLKAATAFAKEGWAPSMVFTPKTGIVMNIESLAID